MTGSDITKELETLRRRVAELECLLTEREQEETKKQRKRPTSIIW